MMPNDQRVSEVDKIVSLNRKSPPISRGELNDEKGEVIGPKIRVRTVTREVIIRLIDCLEQM